MYKLIAIDIDGTLLNSNGELTERTKEIIKKVTNKNVKVVLTSGRVTKSVQNIADKISADKYIICDNGASIYDIAEDKTIWSKKIDKNIVIDLVNICLENNIYYMVFTDKEIIVKDLKHMALAFYLQRHNCNDEATGINEIKYGGIDYISKIDEPIRRIVVCDQDRVIYNSIVNKLKKYDEVDLLAAPHISNKIINKGNEKIILRYSYAEILPKDTNKWVAIKELIKNIGIKEEEVMAIGDNFNDIAMIQNAGLRGCYE